MSRLPRKYVFDAHEVGIYHCINRCVRRAYLCGFDAVSQVSFEHRRRWLQDRLMFLAGVMGLDVLGFCVMSNHLHLVVRNRPDLVGQWSPEEVARRWYRLCPPLIPGTRELAEEPSDSDLALIVNNPDRLAEIRLRLSSPSWLMRFLTERLARVANREDKVTGRFWEGRFRMQRLLDEWAVAACLVYVDLNPVRAGMADAPESSEYTSVFERLRGVVEACLHSDARAPGEAARQPEVCNDSVPTRTCTTSTRPDQRSGAELPAAHPEFEPPLPPDFLPAQQSNAAPSEGVAPDRVSSDGPTLVEAGVAEQAAAAAGSTASSRAGSWLAPLEITTSAAGDPVPAGRLSNLGCLNMKLEEYLQLLDWTGRQWRAEKPAKIGDHLAPILERLGLDGEGWLALVGTFRGRLRRAGGRPVALEAEAVRRGRRWIQGVAASRLVFGKDHAATTAGKT